MAKTLCIEIGKEALKAALVDVRRRSRTLLSVFAKYIDIYQEDEVSNILNRMIDDDPDQIREAIVSLPRNLVTVRNVHLPAKSIAELENMLSLHIGRIVPYKKEEVVCGWKECGKDSMGYLRVMLAVANRVMLKKQLAALEQADIFADNVILSSSLIYRDTLRLYKDTISSGGLFIILDVDFDFIDFIVADRESMLFTRSISMSISEFSSAVGVEKLISQIEQSLITFNNEEVNEKPKKIFLRGFRIEPLAAALIEEYGVEVFECFTEIEKLHDDSVSTVSFTALKAAALTHDSKEDIYFDVPEIAFKKTVRQRLNQLMILGMQLFYVVVILCAFLAGSIYGRQTYIDRLKSRSLFIEADIGDLSDKADYIGDIKTVLYQRRIPLYLFNILKRILPPDTSLTYLGMDDAGKVLLRGRATSASSVFALLNSLEQDTNFIDPATRYTRKRRLGDDEVTDFELQFSFSGVSRKGDGT